MWKDLAFPTKFVAQAGHHVLGEIQIKLRLLAYETTIISLIYEYSEWDWCMLSHQKERDAEKVWFFKPGGYHPPHILSTLLPNEFFASSIRGLEHHKVQPRYFFPCQVSRTIIPLNYKCLAFIRLWGNLPGNLTKEKYLGCILWCSSPRIGLAKKIHWAIA